MARVKDMTLDQLNCLIEQKVLEFLGDPDSGLALREDFKKELKRRLKSSGKKITQEQALKKVG